MCRAPLGHGPVVQPPVLAWQTVGQDRGDDHPERGPVCGRRLVRLGVIPRSRIPPPGERPAEVAACIAGYALAPARGGSNLP